MTDKPKCDHSWAASFSALIPKYTPADATTNLAACYLDRTQQNQSLEISNALWKADDERISAVVDSLPCIQEQGDSDFDTPEKVMHVVKVLADLTQRHKKLLELAEASLGAFSAMPALRAFIEEERKLR